MEKEIDLRGLACPAPVLRLRDVVAAESPPELTALVDNPAARENVSRFLSSQGYIVQSVAVGENFHIVAQRGDGEGMASTLSDGTAAFSVDCAAQKILVLIATDRMGKGDDLLGQKLLETYIATLKELGDSLWQLVFVNGGVKFTCTDSPVLSEIKEYEAAGVVVLSCGTCMEHFGLTGKKAVGGLTNMLDIVMAMQYADKVITID